MYCNASNKCAPQLGRGSDCTNSRECKNKYLCNNKKCIEYFSLNDGEKIINNDTDEIPLEYFCKYATVNYTDKTCYRLYNERKYSEDNPIPYWNHIEKESDCSTALRNFAYRL